MSEAMKKFSTGAVRGTDVKARYDLIPQVGLRRLAETCAEGAEKYGDHNWLKGVPSSNLLNHTLAHIASYLDGDRSEDHLAHAAWGLFASMHNEERRPDVHDVQGQRNVPSPPECPDSDINSLPSTVFPRPCGPSEADDDPTATKPSRADAALAVLERIFKTSSLPDGTQVLTSWTLDEKTKVIKHVHVSYKGTCLIASPSQDGFIKVYENHNGRLIRTAVCWELEEALDEAVDLEVSGAVLPAVGSSVDAGLQEPNVPASPVDDGFDDWVDLVTRVNASPHRPWQDPRSGEWCARHPCRPGSPVRRFGQGDAGYSAAYRFVARHLLFTLDPVQSPPFQDPS
jgi:hypothetical protein